jgi:amino acid permease
MNKLRNIILVIILIPLVISSSLALLAISYILVPMMIVIFIGFVIYLYINEDKLSDRDSK